MYMMLKKECANAESVEDLAIYPKYPKYLEYTYAKFIHSLEYDTTCTTRIAHKLISLHTTHTLSLYIYIYTLI
jgi:hypothetical protein